MNRLDAANKVLDFWFGDAVDGDAEALERAFNRWFRGGSEADETIRARFGDEVATALAGGFSEWEREPRSRLALIVLLDQFPRNTFRHSARAFTGDERALRLARRTVADGEDRRFSLVERIFLLMPYQHAEDIEVQREGVAFFEALACEPASPGVSSLLRSSLEYARKHREIIARFGRFPYRNEVLGREDTPEEIAWLATANERFGQ